MHTHALRFLHAGDLHLERPLGGLDALGDSIRDRLIDAPLSAARQVFETAILEEVDFVVLSGDIIDTNGAGPRAMELLLDQLRTLDENGIAVYWAGGKVDSPERWPDALALPDGVHLFQRGRVEELSHFRDDEAIATISGMSWDGRGPFRAADYRGDPNSPFNVGVAYGNGDEEALAAQNIGYWALGGKHARETLFSARSIAHYAGSPQGRGPDEHGPHGCTLVEVDDDGQAHTKFIITDAVRFQNAHIDMQGRATSDDIEKRLHEHISTLLSEANDNQPLLVSWTISGARMNAGQGQSWTEEIVQRLRGRYGSGSRPLWTVSVRMSRSEKIPSSYFEEDTILGDYLRAIRDHENDSNKPLDVAPFLSERQLNSTLADALEITDVAVRERSLAEAAALGFDLLRGEA